MKSWQFWVGVLISVVFIWLALRGLHFDDLWTAIKQAIMPGSFRASLFILLGSWSVLSPYRLALWVRAVGVKPFTLNEKETGRG